MDFRKLAVSALCVVTLFAAGVFAIKYEDWVTIPDAREAIRVVMRDPSATQFDDERFASNGWLCGWVNAKNTMGGYIGFRRYMSGGKEGPYLIEGEDWIGIPRSVDLATFKAQHNELTDQYLRLRARNSGIEIPSEETLKRMAMVMMFKALWTDVCESKLPTTV